MTTCFLEAVRPRNQCREQLRHAAHREALDELVAAEGYREGLSTPAPATHTVRGAVPTRRLTESGSRPRPRHGQRSSAQLGRRSWVPDRSSASATAGIEAVPADRLDAMGGRHLHPLLAHLSRHSDQDQLDLRHDLVTQPATIAAIRSGRRERRARSRRRSGHPRRDPITMSSRRGPTRRARPSRSPTSTARVRRASHTAPRPISNCSRSAPRPIACPPTRMHRRRSPAASRRAQ